VFNHKKTAFAHTKNAINAKRQIVERVKKATPSALQQPSTYVNHITTTTIDGAMIVKTGRSTSLCTYSVVRTCLIDFMFR
jgi:hypothetical protein